MKKLYEAKFPNYQSGTYIVAESFGDAATLFTEKHGRQPGSITIIAEDGTFVMQPGITAQRVLERIGE